MKSILRRIRGTLGNALVWGAMWFGATFVLATGYVVLGPSNLSVWDSLVAILWASFWNAVVGFVTGGAFSAYIGSTFRDKRLEDLSPVRFAVFGSLVAIPLTLLAVISVRVGALGELPMLQSLIRPMLFSATLGGLTGFGSVKLAQAALLQPPGTTGELGHGSEHLLSEQSR